MEIGSEFWLEKYKKVQSDFKVNKNEVLLMSGRTAIDFAIEILQKNQSIKKVYMPSYCCESMLISFLNKNIEIEFYDVLFESGKLIYNIDLDKECDIFFAMNYFGFSSYNMDYYIECFKRRSITVIEDSTHSFLSERKCNKKSDIVIASLRKWFPIISGAILIVNNKDLIDNVKVQEKKLIENYDYTNIKELAMIEKEKYIHKKEQIEKSAFLDKFKKANEVLNQKYKNYKIDSKSEEILKSLNVNEITKARRKNAKIIYNYLKCQNEYAYLNDIDFDKDSPLFIPIFIKEEKRNELRKYLTQNNIYCPVHWSIPGAIKNKQQAKIYNMELSLICDQRYCENDIQKYINLVKVFGISSFN